MASPERGGGSRRSPARRLTEGSSRSLVGADVLGGPPKAFTAHGEGGAKRCHCEPVLTLVWQSVYSVPRRGCPFLLLVQKKGTKENDTREGKISISPPPWTIPHSNDQTGLASPFWISPGILTRSLCGGWHPRQPVSSRRRRASRCASPSLPRARGRGTACGG